MDTIKVKNCMVELEEYPKIGELATLLDAALALESAMTPPNGARHRTVLVINDTGGVIGRLDELDILRSLEPKYSENRDLKKLSGFGLSADFLRTTLNQFDLWKAPLDDICRKSMKLNVAGLIESPIEGEFIDADASINQAVHQMIMGHHHTLLVTKAQTVVGVLRIDDVFHEICARMRACKL